MIKSLHIELNDVGVAAFVVRVARAASLRFLPSVKTSLVAKVGAHVFVTLTAQRVLRLTIESAMATVALRFGFGVPKNDFARGKHGLNALSHRVPRSHHDEHNHHP